MMGVVTSVRNKKRKMDLIEVPPRDTLLAGARTCVLQRLPLRDSSGFSPAFPCKKGLIIDVTFIEFMIKSQCL